MVLDCPSWRKRSWVSFGSGRCQLGVSWVSAGCQLDVSWVSAGCQLGVSWMSAGCQLGVSWMSAGENLFHYNETEIRVSKQGRLTRASVTLNSLKMY